MTLDLDVICISGVPISGIAAIGSASARQFFLGDVELMRLAGLDDEFAPVSLSDAAGNHASEITVTEPVEDDLNEALERLAELRSAGLTGVCFRYALCSNPFMSLMVAANASGRTVAPSP